jgi:hypothetical protein
MPAILIFVYLQALDFLTTLVGFRVGASEVSPFIVKLIHVTSPALGVAVSKLVALALGAVCVTLNKSHLVTWINFWYAGLVIWNLFMILTAASRMAPGH